MSAMLSRLVNNRWTRAWHHRRMGRLIARQATRDQLNRDWSALDLAGQESVYLKYAKLFRNQPLLIEAGRWPVRFLDGHFSLPIRSDQMWLDWDLCLSVLGHEIEIKQTYLNLLTSDLQFDLMVDVGANYGTHAALFMANGIDAVLFEPNTRCMEYLRQLVDGHDWTAQLHQAAVGCSHDPVSITYPEQDSWLGMIGDASESELAGYENVLSEQVAQVMLDDFVDQWSAQSLFLKIDTEGYELNVLKGARRLLSERRPWIQFEAWQANQRLELFRFFRETQYDLHTLPFSPNEPGQALDEALFLACPDQNFLAVPVGAASA